MPSPLTFSGAPPAATGAQQVLILPYLRASPIHIPRRDLVLSASDSLTLRVTVVESDDPSALALELSGGIGGPMARLRVWGHAGWHWDYGWPWPGARMLLSADGVISSVPGSFDFFLAAGALSCLPRRCGWSVHLTWDDSSDGVEVPPGSPILLGGFQQSELLASGALHVRWTGGCATSAPVPLLTDDSFPVLTDGGEGTGGDTALVTEGVAMLTWPSAAGAVVTNGAYELALSWPWQSGVIDSVTANTGNGSFAASVLINGSTVAGLSSVPVSGATPVTTTAGANALATGDNLTLVISASGGSPTDATVQVTYTRSAT